MVVCSRCLDRWGRADDLKGLPSAALAHDMQRHDFHSFELLRAPLSGQSSSKAAQNLALVVVAAVALGAMYILRCVDALDGLALSVSVIIAKAATTWAIPTTTPPHVQASSQPSWHKYVRASPSTLIKPKAIVAGWTVGNVVNPEGLLGGGDMPTILTRLGPKDPVPCLVVDSGLNTVGQLQVDFAYAKPVAGVATAGLPGIQLAFSESIDYGYLQQNRSDFTRSDHAADPTKGKVVYNGNDQIAVKAGPYTWINEQGCEYGDQVCSDGLHGFRYVRVCLKDSSDAEAAEHSSEPYTTPYGTVAISSVRLGYVGYHGTPDTFSGWFECSDDQLTQWWFDGVYTTDMSIAVFNNNDTDPRNANSPTLLGKLVLHDGAKRDRDPYVGDLAVSSLTTYLSHDVAQATLNVLADLAEHQRSDGWIPPASINSYTLKLFDYPLWWVKCVYDVVLYTGNTEFLSTYWPNLVQVLDMYYPATTDAATGLLTKPDEYNDYAFVPRTGIITYFNALYVLALKHAAYLATLQKDYAHAESWTARAATVSAALVQRNWDNSVGAFFDGGPCPSSSSEVCATHGQDGNGIAILAGVANSSASISALEFLTKATARPYGNAFFDNDALSAGYADRVYAFISYWDVAARLSTSVQQTASTGYEQLRRLYGWMNSHDPGVTFWEGISTGGQPYEGAFTSLAHGWSSGVTSLLTEYLLGVRPLEVGYSRWSMRPVIEGSGVTWAKGRVPTPARGTGQGIDASWMITDSVSGLALSVNAPQGTNGIVSVPLGAKGAVVTVDGIVVFPDNGVADAGAYGVVGPDEDGYVSFNVTGGAVHDVLVGPKK